jgi:hypothetical protein
LARGRLNLAAEFDIDNVWFPGFQIFVLNGHGLRRADRDLSGSKTTSGHRLFGFRGQVGIL